MRLCRGTGAFLEGSLPNGGFSPREAAQGSRAARRDGEQGSLLSCALIASVCSPYGLPPRPQQGEECFCLPSALGSRKGSLESEAGT